MFPVIRSPPSGEVAANINNESHKSDTIASLSHLPSWLSMPSLPVPRQPHALMAIDPTCDDDTFTIEKDEDDAEGRGGERGRKKEQDHADDPFYTPTPSIASSPVSSSRRKQPRRENTARRSKRFSLPAIGLQTTVVTARTSVESEEAVVIPVTTATEVGEEGVVIAGEGGNTGLLKRYSLDLAGENSHQVDGAEGKGQHEHCKGLAAARLSELLST